MKRTFEVYTKKDGLIVVIGEFNLAREAFDYAREARKSTRNDTGIYVREKGHLHFMMAF